jgi:hypothetical protein
LGRKDVGLLGDEEYVVEGEGFGDPVFEHVEVSFSLPVFGFPSSGN